MYNIILILIAFAVAVTIIRFLVEMNNKKSIHNSRPIDNIGSYFTLKKYFFTQSEKAFFDELQKQNNDQYFIISKVRLEDIVSASKALDWREKGIKRNYIKSKHLDFVILDKQYGNILAVIELDGKSHNTEKQGKYDQIKDDILNTVGVKFYRIRVGEEFINSIHIILSEIKGA